MRSDEVEEENKDRYGSIGRLKGMKATLCFVPSLKAVVKGFNEVVADIIFKTLYPNVLGVWKETFGRYFVSRVTITDNKLWIAHRCNVAE